VGEYALGRKAGKEAVVPIKVDPQIDALTRAGRGKCRAQTANIMKIGKMPMSRTKRD
jgi:hypothetical protein